MKVGGADRFKTTWVPPPQVTEGVVLKHRELPWQPCEKWKKESVFVLSSGLSGGSTAAVVLATPLFRGDLEWEPRKEGGVLRINRTKDSINTIKHVAVCGT